MTIYTVSILDRLSTYQPFRSLYERSVHPVHLLIQAAGIAEVMS